MKYVLTNENNEVVAISETLDYQSNGNPLISNGALAIASYLVSHTYENVEIPEGVVENKYCYTTEKGFYKNPNWQEPPMSLEERITNLELAMVENYESGLSNNG